MQLRGSDALWRLIRIVAPRRPYMANGIISAIAAKKIGMGNPLLSLLDVNRSHYPLDSSLDYPLDASSPRYNKDIVRYAGLTLSHLTSSGFYTAAVHLHRLLDIVQSSRDMIQQLDLSVLLTMLKSCERILSANYPVTRRRTDTATTDINTVKQRALECAKYISYHVSAVGQGELMGDFATIICRMQLHNQCFTKRLLSEIDENVNKFSTDGLIGSLRYLIYQAINDPRGYLGAIYRILDALSDANLTWEHTIDVLGYMVQAKVFHPTFLDNVTSSLMDNNESLGNEVLGMDTISSPQICAIFRAFYILGYEKLGLISDAFINRYSYLDRHATNDNMVLRDMRKCTLADLLDLLKVILASDPTLVGAGRSWALHILQHRVTVLVGKASLYDLQELFHVFGNLDPELYHCILAPRCDAKWHYGVGKVNVTSALVSNTPLLGPKALAKAVICYSVTLQCYLDMTIRRDISRCIQTMCSYALRMLSQSSLITTKVLSQAHNFQDDDSSILVSSVDHITTPSGTSAIADDHAGTFLYDPSKSSNYKYMKLGESRTDAKNRESFRYRKQLLAKANKSQDVTVGMGKPCNTDTESPVEGDLGPVANTGESTNTLMEVLRVVHQSLCIHHQLCCSMLTKPYKDWSVSMLEVVARFIKAYRLFMKLHGANFQSIEHESALYGVDGSYNSRIVKALRSVDPGYVDSRFLCTSESHEIHKNRQRSVPKPRVLGAKLRIVHVDVVKPSRSKVRLNWDHFDDPSELRRQTRPKKAKKLLDGLQDEIYRVSQAVDQHVHGHRELVEYYDMFVSRHFKGKLACLSKESSGGTVTPSGITTSRMHKQVTQALESIPGIQLEAEVACGAYHIDLVAQFQQSA
ncbi:uncharacterized protein BXIN_0228 [Babesia sp. Xinjiang]|uniref:uncharacterized protein n=1 Tax=Babesia sp. Xinjiang TaxID=462227 RepID=UPI000A236BE5|nr:uncharacterized protein BXIN_0228 [Babesia sp. Xinjiang]ORM39871.1 hypothetical protein BXIN_0228 [Babesia sp. Xinjiang]